MFTTDPNDHVAFKWLECLYCPDCMKELFQNPNVHSLAPLPTVVRRHELFGGELPVIIKEESQDGECEIIDDPADLISRCVECRVALWDLDGIPTMALGQ